MRLWPRITGTISAAARMVMLIPPFDRIPPGRQPITFERLESHSAFTCTLDASTALTFDRIEGKTALALTGVEIDMD